MAGMFIPFSGSFVNMLNCLHPSTNPYRTRLALCYCEAQSFISTICFYFLSSYSPMLGLFLFLFGCLISSKTGWWTLPKHLGNWNGQHKSDHPYFVSWWPVNDPQEVCNLSVLHRDHVGSSQVDQTRSHLSKSMFLASEVQDSSFV